MLVVYVERGRGVLNSYLDRGFRPVIVIIEECWGVVYLATTLMRLNDRGGARPREWGRSRPDEHQSLHELGNLT